MLEFSLQWGHLAAATGGFLAGEGMKGELKHFLQALLIVLSHFGAAYLLAAVFLPASGAFLVGLGAATSQGRR